MHPYWRPAARLSNSIAVTTYVFYKENSALRSRFKVADELAGDRYKFRDNQETTFSMGLTFSKSLSAGPVRLRACIWLLIELMPTVVSYI